MAPDNSTPTKFKLPIQKSWSLEEVIKKPGGFKFPFKLSIDEYNDCVYLGPGSVIHTDLDFSSFFTADHTLAGWFMPQWVYALDGPLFASQDGRFQVGQGDYARSNRWTDSEPMKAGDPILTVIVNGTRSVYLAPTWQRATWHHVACVRSGSTFSLFLDGVELTPVTVGSTKGSNGQKATSPASKPTAPAGYVPVGKVVLGQSRKPGALAYNQAYGLLDDVAVFGKALSVAEINALVTGKRLQGYEDGLIAGWGLDVGKTKALLPPKLRGETQQWDIPTEIKVSKDRNNASDGPLLDNPWVYAGSTPAIAWPFPKGEAWRVIQSMNDPLSSHHGYAAFCYDLMLADHPQTGEYPKGTRNAPVYASISGDVVWYLREGVMTTPREPNAICTVNGNCDTVTYLHLAPDSMSDAVLKGDHTSTTVQTPWPSDLRPVKQFDQIAELGPGAAHLHIAGGEIYADDAHPFGVKSETTCAVGFNDIEVRFNGSGPWVKVDPCYFPQRNDWVRRI